MIHFVFFFFHLRGKEVEIHWFTPQMLQHNSQRWVKPKPGSSSSTLAFHMGDSILTLKSSSAAFQRVNQQEVALEGKEAGFECVPRALQCWL